MEPTITMPYDHGDGSIVEIDLPARFEVCSVCNGHGKHDHPAFSNGITGEEWNGPDWDDDSREAYMCGDYDVVCTWCKGERVVAVIDRSRCTAVQLTYLYALVWKTGSLIQPGQRLPPPVACPFGITLPPRFCKE